MDIAIHRNDTNGRYELHLDGQLASFADFRREGDTVVMPHTVTLPAYRGQGLAAQVVRAALDDFLEEHVQVVPSCWFVAEVIEAHEAYRSLVEPDSE